jgi:hypothetical protein
MLEWVLRTAAAGAGSRVGFAIDRGVVLVSTRDQLDRMVITRAYDVADLTAEPGQWAGPNGQDVDAVVRNTVAPSAWAEAGGPGSILRFRDKLLVTTTEPIHREVEKLLALLRRDAKAAAGNIEAVGTLAQGMSHEDIAEVDAKMADLMKLRQEIALEIEDVVARGATPEQPAVVQLMEKLKSRDALAEERAAWFREKYKGYRFAPGRGMLVEPVGAERLRREAQRIWEEKYAPQVVEIGGQNNYQHMSERFKEEVVKRLGISIDPPPMQPR